MLWIKYRKGEPIPENMYYPGWRTDREKYDRCTPLMLWNKHRPNEPIPEKLK